MVKVVTQVTGWLDRHTARQLARSALILLIPALFFWINVVFFLITHNSLLLDLFFNNHIIGYILVAFLPLVSGVLGYFSYRKHHGLSSQSAIVLGTLFFLMFLAALLRQPIR